MGSFFLEQSQHPVYLVSGFSFIYEAVRADFSIPRRKRELCKDYVPECINAFPKGTRGDRHASTFRLNKFHMT